MTDGEFIFVHIGNVGLFVTTMTGDPVWSTRFDAYPMHLDFGVAASVAVDDELANGSIGPVWERAAPRFRPLPGPRTGRSIC